jgi:hypothetical protein
MAFPTTSVLDDFNRADSSSLGSNWTEDVRNASESSPIITGNQAGRGSGVTSTAWWNASTFGPDCEVYVDLPTIPVNTGVGLMIRVQNPDTASYDGYYLFIQRNDTPDGWALRRLDDKVETVLGAGFNQDLSAGDKIGIEAIGSTIKAFHYTGGAWVERASRTDSTYGSAGYISMLIGNSTTWRLDNFAGGTVVSASATWPGFITPFGWR